MVLSRIRLDPTRRATMKALAAPNLLHGAIEQSFPGPRERRLWRIDRLGAQTWLLVLSRTSPDFTSLEAQYGCAKDAPAWESRSYDPLLARIEPGTLWHFRLTANPTVSKPREPGHRGKVLGHITETYQKQWLLGRAARHGFALDENRFSVVESRWLRFRKGMEAGRPVTLLSVTYEGLLSVTDAARFRQTLCEGLGRGKAYGLGLLTVAGTRGGA